MAQLNYGITLIVIVAMSCTHGHAMHTEDHKDSVAQTTVASILTQIADAVDVVTKNNQPHELGNSIDLLKKIFVQTESPHIHLNIFANTAGHIQHAYAEQEYPSLRNLTNDPNFNFLIKDTAIEEFITIKETNMFHNGKFDSVNQPHYLNNVCLSLVKTIINQFKLENGKSTTSYGKNLKKLTKILSTSSSNNVFICFSKKDSEEDRIPKLFCSYFLSCILHYIRNQIKQTQTNQLSEKATLNEGNNTVKSSWQGNAIETKSLSEGEKSCTVSAKKCKQPMHLDTLNVNTASEHPFQQVDQTEPDNASSNKEESQESQPTPQIRKTGDNNVSDKKEEKKSNQEKRSFRDIILIGSCGSVILCLSAILYWYYKK